MKVKVVEIGGLHPALTAMRYSFKSTPATRTTRIDHLPQSDSGFGEGALIAVYGDDLDLLERLVLCGDSHAKVCRMITVWVELTLPRYMWSEFDTYKVGTTAMSESTVHTLVQEIKQKKVTSNEFEFDKDNPFARKAIENWLNLVYTTPEDQLSLEAVKSTLPEGFLQKRMVCLNYQTIRHIYFDRRNHRLPIWHVFLDSLMMQLPFSQLITAEAKRESTT